MRSVGGFALVLVVTLLAFLVLLVVALATFTKIETQAAGNTQRQAQARQNALLALNVALGQLQKYAGPDTRATAIAEGQGYANKHYTGVWDSASSDRDPLVWLVSGSEIGAVNPATVFTSTTGVELVGVNTSGRASDVVAPVQTLTTTGLPGQTGSATIGRYAWWVGDQGVKADVALTDRTNNITYPPYDSDELRSRLRQQIGFGAGPTEFEPQDTANQPLVPKVFTPSQLAFLKRTGSTTTVGATLLKQRYHTWSAGNHAVLASTAGDGLRRDLSLKPDLLGSAFAAWADYPTYMDLNAPAIRKRYNFTAPIADRGLVFSVAPVLSTLLLNFNLQTTGTSGTLPIQARLRCIAGFWNPYSSAFTPEDLRIEVSGLPNAVSFVDSSNNSTLATLNLQSLLGTPFVFQLPWESNRADLVNQPDVQSWFPGRLYYWISNANSSDPNIGFFYSKTLIGFAANIVRVSGVSVSASKTGTWNTTSPSTITVRLFRGTDTTPLAVYSSPQFEPFSTSPVSARAGTAQFSYFFRLDQNKSPPATIADETWLISPGRDPRNTTFPSEGFVSGNNGPNPEQYPGTPAITNNDLLVERTMGTTGQSYNEDTPIFELPRSPLLSLGMLQHIQVAGGRSFTIGNSWGNAGGWNALFDRYFFTGLAAGVTTSDFSASQSLPNPLLRLLSRKPDGNVTTVADLTAETDAGYSSKFLLQNGAFNLNSVSPDAWLAVLRSVRYPGSLAFTYLNPSVSTGTGDDLSTLSKTPSDALFFRFSQSAQETFKASDPTATSTYAASNTEPPAAPSTTSQANTHLFRRGMKELAADETGALADAIVAAIKTKHAASGPFRTLEEFLNPSPLFNGQSLLEQAIANTDINDDPNNPGSKIEFSSQFLTQGDIMTALAPILFPRSDTFVIRTYGEAVNPATSATEGRAWCEAAVQRYPEYFDKTQPEETLPADLNVTNQNFGRRFKIISFRWLTRSDI